MKDCHELSYIIASDKLSPVNQGRSFEVGIEISENLALSYESNGLLGQSLPMLRNTVDVVRDERPPYSAPSSSDQPKLYNTIISNLIYHKLHLDT